MFRALLPVVACLALVSCQTSSKTASGQPSLEQMLARAQKGDADAQRYVGEAYLGGHGVALDVGRGCEWLDKAAQAGDAKAALRLSEIYRSYGNMERALGYLEKSAAAGEPEACYQLGLHYLSSGTLDWGKAKEQLARAARAGHSKAAYVLGRYEEYEGQAGALEAGAALDKNIAILLAHQRAEMELYEKDLIIRRLRGLAEKGDASSQFMLGEMLADTAKDRWGFLEACRWYSSSAQKGVPEGEARKERLLEQLPPEEAQFVASQLTAYK
jgi:TPR repeat protein